jgi:hypothetical protein
VAAADIVLRPSAGGNNITLDAAQTDAPASTLIVLSPVATSIASETIRLFPPGQGDSTPLTVVALTGLRATTAQNSFVFVAVALTGLRATTAAGTSIAEIGPTLTGQAATSAQGGLPGFGGGLGALVGLRAQTRAAILEETFTFDTFTDTNGTLLDAHTGEVGKTWTLVAGFSDATINSNKVSSVHGAGALDNSFESTGTPTSNNYYAECDLIYNGSGDEGTGSWVGDYIGVRASHSAGAQMGYFFGWDTVNSRWRLWTQWTSSTSSITTLATSTSNVPSTVGDTRRLRVEVADGTSGHVLLKCFVDDVVVIDYDDTSAFITATGLAAIRATAANSTPSMKFDNFKAGLITRKLVGQVATTAAGTVVGSTSGGSTQSLTGLSATAIAGSLTPAVFLVGLVATTAQGALVPLANSITGLRATTAAGLLSAVINVGATGAVSFLPSIQMNFVTRSFPGGAGYLPITNAPISVNGVLRGTYDDVNTPTRTNAYDPGVQGFRRYVRKDGSAAFTPSATQELGEYNPYYRDSIAGGRYTPNGEEFDYEIFGGGHFSVDRDRQMHWVHSRAFAFKDSNWIAAGDATHFRPRWGDPTYIYQSDYNVAQDTRNGQEIDHSLPYAFVRSNVYFDKNREHLLGPYAHDQHNVWLFYPEPWTAPFVFAGLRGTTRQGALTPSIAGQSSLQPGIITTRQGVLAAKIDGQPLLTGQRVTASAGALLRDDPTSIVPAYVRGDGYRWDTTHQVLLKDFTGTECFTLRDYMTVVRSGYGDVVYLVYLSGSSADRYTAAYVGVIVLDVVTAKVYSHTLTAITGSRPTGYTDSVSRPLADVCKMSTGTSVTQFTMNGWVFHLTWSSGTYTTPTVTQKTAPSVPSGMTGFLPGFESFDYKGDEAYHALFSYTTTGSAFSGFTIHLRVTRNDATGTGSVWTTPVVDTFSALLPSGVVLDNAGYSGYGDALSTWMLAYWENTDFSGVYPIGEGAANDTPFQRPTGLFTSSGGSLAFNYKAFANQQPYLSLAAEARVGTVSVTVIQGTAVALTGLATTTSAGAIGTQSNFTLTGLRITTAQGTIFFSVPGSGDLNPGLRITTAQGLLTGVLDKALTGLAATSTSGTLTPNISVALTGQVATTAAGALAPSTSYTIALTGLQAVTTQGVLTPVMTNVGGVSGQSAACTAGTLVPDNRPLLVGARAMTAAGALGVDLGATLTGQRLTLAQGVAQILLEIALTGRSATARQGLIAISADCIVNAQGVFATGVVGRVSTDVPAVSLDHQLWARSEVTKLFTQDRDDELYNLNDPARG